MSILVFDTVQVCSCSARECVKSCEGNVVQMGNHRGKSLIKNVGGSVTVRKVDGDKRLIYVH